MRENKLITNVKFFCYEGSCPASEIIHVLNLGEDC